MKYIYFIIISLLLFSCRDKTVSNNTKSKKNKLESKMISKKEEFADSPFITEDNNQNPVITWVEGEEENTFLYYAIFKNDEKSFSEPIKISSSKGLTAHHETMPKIAFKENGNIVAVFQKRTPTPKNRFAGAIYYSESSDKGNSWSKPQYLHTDTSPGIGRSFFDIARLPNGEIGAIWLDGRKKQRNGSTLCFSKTSKNNGFGIDKEIGQKTCQCCRTDLFVDKKNKIHVAYRDIINDTIRDIVHLASEDNGDNFTKSKRISEDNWVINGCPHTGPSITDSENGVEFFWFTSGGKDGVFNTQLTNGKEKYKERSLVNPHARHPQATTLTNGTIALSWDETFKTGEGYINRIGLLLRKIDGTETTQYITPKEVDCNHPVISEIGSNNILITWTQRNIELDKTQVNYTVINL